MFILIILLYKTRVTIDRENFSGTFEQVILKDLVQIEFSRLNEKTIFNLISTVP